MEDQETITGLVPKEQPSQVIATWRLPSLNNSHTPAQQNDEQLNKDSVNPAVCMLRYGFHHIN